ncbi:MAG: symmetrical bis(5'-nucleosyl)-tetraphosphatase [Mariprofundales bacterium]
MSIYAVGDIQGCYDCLRRLLDKAGFKPNRDQLWCAGDLINRGPDSLATLRFLRDLGDHCIAILGNHDLHLLRAVANDTPPPPTLQHVIDAADCNTLIEWLRHRPLLYRDKKVGWAMVHAGLHPHWTLQQADKRAKSIHKQLRSTTWRHNISTLLTIPTITQQDEHQDAFALAILTRSRFCTADGTFNWKNSSNQADHHHEKPWFSHKNARWRCDTPHANPHNCRLLFGHWSAKGVVDNQPHVLGLDSGCVWGNRLTLARIDQEKPQLFSIPCHGQC